MSEYCRFCGGEDLKQWSQDYYRCNDCLFICTVPAPTVEDLKLHYSTYHENNHQASQLKNEQRSQSYKQEVEWLMSQIGRSLCGNIFDYGASGGYLLDCLANVGGVEKDLLAGDDASPGAINSLKEKGYFQPFDAISENSLSLAIMRGVLEHLLDFRDVVEKLCFKVKVDGYFFITATPDSSCTVANIYREKWVQHHYPSHFQHFNSSLVDRILGENGFIPFGVVDLYFDSIYRGGDDDSVWLNTVRGDGKGSAHAYWGSMMTRLYKKV